MRPVSVPSLRIVAVSIAITLVVVPIASAQSPESPIPSSTAGTKAMLNTAAFARLVHVPTGPVLAPAPKDSPRLRLLRQATIAMARQVQPPATKPPQQGSWVSRHRTLLIVLGVIGGGIALTYGILVAASGYD